MRRYEPPVSTEPPRSPCDPTWLRERLDPLACPDCGLHYGGIGWCDAHVPTDVWIQISPSGNEGGVLCITCMARRIELLGLDNVPLLIGSGPWDFDTAIERTRLEALEQGRRQGREEVRS